MSNIKRRALSVAIALAVITLAGCADSVTFEQAASIEPVGFWYGLWHGVTFPFSWVGSLFVDSISIYAIYNNGGWYDFGFWVGISMIGRGVSIATS